MPPRFPNDKKFYLELFSQTESLIKWVEQYSKDDSIIKDIQKMLSKYKDLSEVKKQEEENILKWPATKVKRNKNNRQSRL